MRYATSVLTDRQADSGETGVRFAHLATAWTHMERGEVDRQDNVLIMPSTRGAEHREPLLASSSSARPGKLAVITDEPETALRLLHSPSKIDFDLPMGWFADQLVIARAEAWLAAGEPEKAIAALSPEPDLAYAEARLILGTAWLRLGELPAAETMLARVPSDVATTTLTTQIRRWLLVAELAVAAGNRERAELVVDRALRAATMGATANDRCAGRRLVTIPWSPETQVYQLDIQRFWSRCQSQPAPLPITAKGLVLRTTPCSSYR